MVMDKIKQYTYYIIIGVISLFALIFLPMVGSEIGLGWNLPTTAVGWTVYIVIRVLIAALNILIFHCFVCQAKVNVQDNTQYKAANEILGRIKVKEYVPRSPRAYLVEQYSLKGTTIFLSSLVAGIALTQAVLTFDYVACLTYLFTIVMGIIFGILQMKKDELYWTTEYYDYAKQKELSNDNN